MRFESLIILAFVSTLILSESLKGTYEQIIIFSCHAALASYKFGCDDDFWKCACSYEPLLGSTIQCIDSYLPESVPKKVAYDQLISSCSKFGKINISKELLDDVQANSSSLVISPDDKDFDPNSVHYVPILPFKEKVIPKMKDYRAFLGNFDIAQHYGVLLNLFWLAAITWFAFWNRLKRSPNINDRLVGKNINKIRSYLSLPLLFGTHFQPFIYLSSLTSLIPTTAEGIVLFIYFFLNTTFLFYGFQIYKENSIFGPNIGLQISRYMADRSGILSFAHFPLLVLFAGRNNILINFSGLPYSSFMIFHKWTARVMFIDAAIHSICYLGIFLSRNNLNHYFAKYWFQAGLIAFFGGVFLLLFAIHTIRARFYEMFLISHIVFALIFFITCYGHCAEFGWLEWVSAALVLWIGDRLIRLYKLFKFGAPIAQIQFISDGTYKLSVQRPHHWKPFPGCFVFIHFLHPSIFWQSHPFTIVDSVLKDEEVTIYIKAKEGLTQKVMNLIGESTSNMRVSLEGPYGNQSPVDHYENVILFAGGNGIPGPFYHALHLANKSLLQRQRIRLIWVIRRVESIEWFEAELRQLSNANVECDIYITREYNPRTLNELKAQNQFGKLIKFHKGRSPNDKILLDEFNNSSGSIGIVTCGPSIMCDQIRDFVSNNLDQCLHRVDLFEELQVW